MNAEIKSFLYTIILTICICIPILFTYFIIDDDNFIKRRRNKMREL